MYVFYFFFLVFPGFVAAASQTEQRVGEGEGVGEGEEGEGEGEKSQGNGVRLNYAALLVAVGAQ